jgi:histidinol-phosphatase (PHP family)
LNRGAVLTDYHLHLRSDDADASAAANFTAANAAAYREAAEQHGIAELGVSEHIYRFHQALELWQHPFWDIYARDDLDEYCEFVRLQTDLRLGIEMDFVPGQEDRTANLLAARDFDYVVGSVHFTRDGAVDMDDYSAWDSGRSVEQVWERYFETVAESARSGLFDIIAHPDLVKYWSAGDGDARRPRGDLRRYYEPTVEAFAEAGVAVEVSTAGLRKPAGEIYPAPPFLAMCKEAGVPVALSSDAHRREDVGADYDRALELLDELGIGELSVFERRVRRLLALGAGLPMTLFGIGYDSHRLVAGPPLLLGGVELPYELGLDGHSDSDVLTHAVIDALLGAGGLGDIGEHFPDDDERWRDADSIALLRAVVAMLAERGHAIVNVDCTVIMEAPKLAPHRQAIREQLAGALGLAAQRVNVKASTGERMGFVGRGEGVAALAVAAISSGG